MRVVIIAGSHQIAQDVKRRITDDLLGMDIPKEPKWIEVLPDRPERLRGLSLTGSDVIAYGEGAWDIRDIQQMLGLTKRGNNKPWEKTYA